MKAWERRVIVVDCLADLNEFFFISRLSANHLGTTLGSVNIINSSMCLVYTVGWTQQPT